jgi:hypothetical protein
MRRSKRSIIELLAAGSVLALVLRPAAGEIFYPWKDVYIGSLDAAAWPGLVLAPGPEGAFAFRFRVEKDGQVAESSDLFYLVSEVGPNSPDGQYARLRFDLGLPFRMGKDTPVKIKPAARADTMTLEWSRQDEKSVLGRLRFPKGTKVSMILYFPWDTQGAYDLEADGRIRGQGGGEARRHHFALWTDRPGRALTPSALPLVVDFPAEDGRSLYFAAGVDEDPRYVRNHIYRYQNSKTIDTILSEEEASLGKKRVRINGIFEGVPDAVSDNAFWSTLFQPGARRFYMPESRDTVFPNPDGFPDQWTIGGGDAFFSALELAVESPRHAVDAVRAVLETQYADGNIPGWREPYRGSPDRSRPPVGSYVVLKLFQRIGDLGILRNAYPYLQKWHAFWTARRADGRIRRDGNGDGLLEWGADIDPNAGAAPPGEENISPKQRAVLESGMDDLPALDEAGWSDETGTLKMNCLDLNSLFALDSWCLSQIAGILDMEQDAQDYLDEYQKVRALINTRLWNEKEGFYFDRHWDGRFSTRAAASNFYPLIARIPDEKRALRVLKHLLDPKKFWGEFIVPTVPRTDPAFKDQQSWRGAVRPMTNYLIYQGLKACGFDAVAEDFARKSADLFLRSWKNFQLCPGSFDARTGEALGRRHQSRGPLLALIAIEEYLDFTPWEGFRFGMLKPEGKGTLSRIAIQGRHYDVEVGPSRTVLREEGRPLVRADGGAVVRRFLYTESEVSFAFKALDDREVRLWLLKNGKHQLLVDDREVKVFTGNSVEFIIPSGDHSVLLMLLEEAQ